MNWIAPLYPIFAWTPTPVGTVSIYNGTTTTVVECLSLAGPGFAVSGSLVATAASLHGKLAAAVVASAGGSCVATYVTPDGEAGPLRVSLQRTGGTGTLTLTFSSLAAAQVFGFDDVGAHSLTTIAPKVTDHNHAGVWRPAGFGARETPDYEMPARGMSEAVGGTPTHYVWGNRKRRLALTFSDVRRANIEPDSASTSSWATAALRVAADPNATLQGMLDALISGDANPSLKFWRSVSDSETLYWLDPPDKLSDVAEDATGAGVYAVTMAWRRG